MFGLFKKKKKDTEPAIKDLKMCEATGTLYTPTKKYYTVPKPEEFKSFYNERWDFGVYWASASKDGGIRNEADYEAFVNKYNLGDYPYVVSGHEWIVPQIEDVPCDFTCIYKSTEKMDKVLQNEIYCETFDEQLLNSSDLYEVLHKYNWERKRLENGWTQADLDEYYSYEEVDEYEGDENY